MKLTLCLTSKVTRANIKGCGSLDPHRQGGAIVREPRRERWRDSWVRLALLLAASGALVTTVIAADVPGSKDPPEMRRYSGSELIGYREPKVDAGHLSRSHCEEFTRLTS